MTEAEEEVGADYYVHNIRNKENENNTSEESHGIPSSQLDDGGQRTEENLATECLPVDMENLREINSRHSSGKPKIQMNGNSFINISEISLRFAPYLEQQADLPKGTSNCGYHSA